MAPRASPDAEEYTPLQREILAALKAQIEPTRSTFTYKLGLFATAMANLLLPLLYFGLIFLVAHAVYWCARYLDSKEGIWWMVRYGACFIGGVTLIFLIKPLFARNPHDSLPLPVKRSAEPFLYEYVEAVCAVVNAPVPTSIRLVCEPNAFAAITGGLWGFVTGRMTLTIGLPLVTGMSVRQLTGVLAHEFGHFSQGGGMRLSYLVRRVNLWLTKIVFLRDAWDERLDELTPRLGLRLAAPVWVARFCIWLSRQLLFGLWWLGNAVSCYLMRQMEFDADRYEARTVGFRTFSSSFTRITELNIAHQMAINDLGRFHSEGRLADNLPALIASNVRHITPELRKEFRKMEALRQTGLFDTHPADRERIASARAESPTGIFHLPGEEKDPPATVLFGKFDPLCRVITTDFYQRVLGKEFKKSLLRPVKQLIQRRDAELEAGKSLDRYFQVHIPVDRPLPLDADAAKPPSRPQEAARELKEARERMLRELVEYKNLPDRYDQAEKALFAAVEAMSLIQCGLRIRAADFDLPDARQKTVEARTQRARLAVQHLAARMLAFETAASERLSAALRLLQVPKVVAAIPEGPFLQEEIRELIRDGRLISEIMGDLHTLLILFRRAAILVSRLGNRPNHRLLEAIFRQMEGMSARLNEIHEKLSGKPYPFDHADAKITLQEFVIPHIPEPMDLAGLVIVTQQLVERLYVLQVRIFARLAYAAEKVEAVLGLPPLPEPETGKTDKKEHSAS